MKRIYTLVLIGVLLQYQAISQLYNDYIGAGHSEGITVTTSHNAYGSNAEASLNGAGMNADRMEAARFLTQASMGYNQADIDSVLSKGYADWIADQISMPYSTMYSDVEAVNADIFNLYVQYGLDTNSIFAGYNHFNYAWYTRIMTQEDYLRQRVAWALSQIMVVSANSDIGGNALNMATYYDMLMNNAFGNYRDLLNDVAHHVCMGYFLSHLNNPKADPAYNLVPDENFAREIMQLFSIGLMELNQDGTPKLDSNGDIIPTYNNNDIKELAKVFTGMHPGEINMYVWWTDEPYFGLGMWGADTRFPMIFDEDEHEQSAKYLFDSTLVIPANQLGEDDLQMVIDTLFNHPNTAPFISYRLIQRLVKSNPSPAYIQRIADVFDDNGNGERGDLGAVITAILLDEEARNCDSRQEYDHGILLEPLFRYTHIMKGLELTAADGRYYNPGSDFNDDLRNGLLFSPTVFNFYRPDHQPIGTFADSNRVAPEYQIHNAVTSVNYINKINQWIVWNGLWWSWLDEYFGINAPELDYSPYLLDTDDPDVFIDKMDILFTRGDLTDQQREVIREAMLQQVWGDYQYNRVQMGLYLMLISPDFTVTR